MCQPSEWRDVGGKEKILKPDCGYWVTGGARCYINREESQKLPKATNNELSEWQHLKFSLG